MKKQKTGQGRTRGEPRKCVKFYDRNLKKEQFKKMTAKQYLSQLKKIDIQIRQLMSEKDFLEAQLTKATMTPREIQVQSSLPADPMADKVARIVDIEKELDEKVDQLIDLRQVIVRQIQSLPNQMHIIILYKRFVEYKRCDTVFEEIRQENPQYTYSDRQLFRTYKSALTSFEKHVSKCQ
mgnify:CR=1 FL=1